MSIFDSVTPKRNLSEPFSGSFSESTGATLGSGSSSAIIDEKGRNELDIELALQKISPVETPFATAVLQTELRKLKEVT